ncbi:MAG: hypothetical protein ACRC2T_17065, partial [Thermoguttaceae bacterium]
MPLYSIIDVLNYYSRDEWNLMQAEMEKRESPFLVVNLNIVKRKYEELKTCFPIADIYYAVKANPATEIIALLGKLGSCFDIASVQELDK